MKIIIDKKKLSYILLSAASISIIAYTFSTIFSLNKKPKQPTIEQPQIKKNEYKFLVKEDSGVIKVFKNGDKTPINVIEKEVEYLPEYDQNMLKNGIYLYNTDDLNKVLEDYED